MQTCIVLLLSVLARGGILLNDFHNSIDVFRLIVKIDTEISKLDAVLANEHHSYMYQKKLLQATTRRKTEIKFSSCRILFLY